MTKPQKKNSESTGAELVPVNGFQAPLLTTEGAFERMVSTFESLRPTVWDLPMLKVPGAGTTAWSVPTEGKPRTAEYVDGVILAIPPPRRAWWQELYGEGEKSPPQCSSLNGIKAFGVNTLDEDAVPEEHLCATCRWSQYQSSRKGGNSQDCEMSYLIPFLADGLEIPNIIKVPPTSLGPLRRYVMGLRSRGLNEHRVVTRFSLEKLSNKYESSGIVFEAVGAVPETWLEKLQPLSKAIAEYTANNS